MARLIAIFNLIAAAASVAGFAFSLQLENRNIWMATAFLLAAGLCLYVLFAPANPIERNVGAKIRRFRHADNDQERTQQHGEFCISNEPASVIFPYPFSAKPDVRVAHLDGKTGPLPRVGEVSELHAQFIMHSHLFRPAKFKWVASGVALEPVTKPNAQDDA